MNRLAVRYLLAIVALIAIAFLLLFLTFPIWEEAISFELAISVTSATISSIALAFLGVEVLLESRVSEATFIETLAQDVDKNILTELRLDGGDLSAPLDALEVEDRSQIIQFLTFFERLSIILSMDVASMRIFNSLFGYRFFLLTHNTNVINHVLLREGMEDSWAEIFRLHKKWIRYRVRHKYRIPNDDTRRLLENAPSYKNA